MIGQLPLPMADRDRDMLTAARLRAACKVVAKELGYKYVADLWRCEESHVGLKLDETSRHYIKPLEMVTLKRVDTRGIILAAELGELGYEMPERKRALDPEEKLRAYQAAAREMLGPELVDVLERKAGLL